MNPPDILPDVFDASEYEMDLLFLRSLPTSTSDCTADRDFSRPFSIEEIYAAKLHIRSRSLHKARGFDGISYRDILEIPNNDLVQLFNLCMSSATVPTEWMVTLLVGIQKKGKPAADPNSYRIIALECCLLKVFTLLCATRIRDWMASAHVLPASQNGFRKGYRTNNCSFILRCAIDRARANDDTLFVAFMDLSNAFPSTNLPTLWRKLFCLGARGPVLDTLRMIYARMEYVVVNRSPTRECSATFRSLWGILAGDSASTDLFNVYIADFDPPPSPFHISLNGRQLSNLLQADDLMLFATRQHAVQLLMSYTVLVWCAKNFLLANALKCLCMIFGMLLRPLPKFLVGESTVPVVDTGKYVGVSFQSTHRCIFMQHYKLQASGASNEVCGIFSVESHVNSLPVAEGLVLYKSRIDPQLTSGCEVSPDTDLNALELLEDVQNNFLRRLLGLHPHSPTVVLFTETGITPIRFRRAILCLKHLRYLLQLGEEQLARSAFEDSLCLWRTCAPTGGWLSDLDNVLANLPSAPGAPTLRLLPSHTREPTAIDGLILAVEEQCSLHLTDRIQTATSLYLLHARPPPFRGYKTAQRYLTCISIPAHRKALTRLLTSCHRLGVQCLKPVQPNRELRTCRWCKSNEVEDVAHCLFHCTGSRDFFEWRADFYARTQNVVDLKALLGRIPDSSALQYFLLNADDECLRALGRLAHRVCAAFERAFGSKPIA